MNFFRRCPRESYRIPPRVLPAPRSKRHLPQTPPHFRGKNGFLPLSPLFLGRIGPVFPFNERLAFRPKQQILPPDHPPVFLVVLPKHLLFLYYVVFCSFLAADFRSPALRIDSCRLFPFNPLELRFVWLLSPKRGNFCLPKLLPGSSPRGDDRRRRVFPSLPPRESPTVTWKRPFVPPRAFSPNEEKSRYLSSL